jgi:hypothetical protein
MTNAAPSEIPAARHRTGSDIQERGSYKARSMNADPAEPAADPQHQLIEFLPPALQVYAEALGPGLPRPWDAGFALGAVQPSGHFRARYRRRSS